MTTTLQRCLGLLVLLLATSSPALAGDQATATPTKPAAAPTKPVPTATAPAQPAAPVVDSAEPQARVKEYPWMSIAKWDEMHAANLARAKAGDVDILFLGDSITQGWGNNGAWKKFFAERKAANFGIGGDTTRTVLWRITNGELDGIQPKAVVILIGTNNFGLHNDKTEDVLRGVTKVVAVVHEKLPKAKILLMGVFPRDAKPDTNNRKRIKALNDGLAKLADDKYLVYTDIGSKYLADDGSIPKDLMPDALHLSEKGYTIWAEAISPTIDALLK